MIINSLDELEKIGVDLKKSGTKIVRTNGCFDIMHPGHIKIFEEAKKLGDVLIVGINGDKSPYWATKPGRPINNEYFRTTMVGAIRPVDYIFVYNEETPLKAISTLLPDLLVKGGDYELQQIVGYQEVINNGGKVITIPIEGTYSTSALITKILDTYSHE